MGEGTLVLSMVGQRAPDHRTALGMAAVHKPEFAVVDLRLKGERGLEVLSDLCERLLDGGAPGLHIYTLNRANASFLLWQRLKR